jgi:glycerol kinase
MAAMPDFVLALDQGTTSSRAMLFDAALRVRGHAQVELPQHYPAEGLVEHEPDGIWQTTLDAMRGAVAQAGATASQIAAIGITNQRETTLLWDRRTGRPVHRAIVWQDRRMARAFSVLRAGGFEPDFAARTGLLLDPYFSVNKLVWLLETIDGLRAAAQAGRLAFGTVDTWLLWNLTGGRVHATDATNASRTGLYNLESGTWDSDLLHRFGVPPQILPVIHDSAASFGVTDAAVLGGEVAILGVAGDQQSAALGQACFRRGMMKATYGTGCFALLNTGSQRVHSAHRLLSTVACQLHGRRTYALEGAIFAAGATVQWLRDGLGLLSEPAQAGTLARDADPGQDVIVVPAFVGLGAPQWRPDVRGGIFGLTRATTKRELARAALQAVAYQTRDLLAAMASDCPGLADTVLRVDGGMAASDYTMQFLADMLNAQVDRPVLQETTALGAAWLAGSHAGIWPDQDGFAASWRRDRRFEPAMPDAERRKRYAAWQRSVAAVIAQAPDSAAPPAAAATAAADV